MIEGSVKWRCRSIKKNIVELSDKLVFFWNDTLAKFFFGNFHKTGALCVNDLSDLLYFSKK